ncbi:MAG: hypothetical protein M1818_002318 [Claussenomyces sp. TS43310]|nr:MAG: hypothetical protein M1818_002318 [Claussenomyces sp. TS43310]
MLGLRRGLATAAGMIVGMAMPGAVQAQCPDFSSYSQQVHDPLSTGRYNLSYMRPDPACRTFNSSVVEGVITSMQSVIPDPDLYRLFENSFPNSLDTAVKWKGYASGSDEELTFLITGDINAMWLRDSANQMQSYLSLLTADDSADSLASLYRGVINLQARYINTSSHCNAFQPPVESGLQTQSNGQTDTVFPTYDSTYVYECKYELDSLAAFLEISTNYYTATGDVAFFSKYNWVDTIQTILTATKALQVGTYAANGSVNTSPYTFQRQTTSGTETLSNTGAGNPVQEGTGLVRSAFRPSDDACIYQLFIPANMMFAHYLSTASEIMTAIGNQTDLATEMASFAASIHAAIETYGIVTGGNNGSMYAYEVDGYGGRNLMDDANIPSLLSAPLIGYLNASDSVYQATRNFVLSSNNPYFMTGPVINAIGGPHDGPGRAWPMASIVRILTSTNETEIASTLKEIVSSTDSLGLIHESISAFDASTYTRPWFSWANGLFGQMILNLNSTNPDVLGQSYQ